MTEVSIRTRLAAWYFLSVALVLGMLAAGSYLAMRASTMRAIDVSLGYQLNALDEFLQAHPEATPAQLGDELARGAGLSVAGGLFQVFDGDGTVLYQSQGLARHRISMVSAGPGGAVSYRNAGTDRWPARLASKRTTVNGVALTIEVAEAMRSYHQSWNAYGRALVLFTPVLALIAGGLGYWISGRALAPVDRIISDAEAIGASNLSERLSVPPAHDELRHLSVTLNAMLDRIEASVSRVTQFTADASHELRAPLALIHMAAEHGLRRERGREELVESLRTILRETGRTSRLVEDLLLLARADSGSADVIAPCPSTWPRSCERSPIAQRALAAAEAIALVRDAPDACVTVMGDASPPPSAPADPRRQRHQVHARGRHGPARAAGGRGRGDDRRHGHRRRHRPGRPAAGLRPLLARRQGAVAQ